MLGSSIIVFTGQRQTQRQISRALHSGGIAIRFIDRPEHVQLLLERERHDLIILDCDSADAKSIEAAIEARNRVDGAPPVIMISFSSDKATLLELIQHHDIGNLVAKHGAIRAVYPVLDERELLVTCEKVLRRNIFGIDKYVGSWGVVLHRTRITKMDEKTPFLNRFEQYLTELDCQPSIIPGIVTVAEELLLNAVVHAPHHPDGRPKYEDVTLLPHLVLDPGEYVSISYGCDGQRLMLSVTDNFGRLNKKTLHNYLARGFDAGPLIEAEQKPGGAGLGLSMSFRSIHQLIFNIQDSVRTEVIAGWYLRVNNAGEFRQVGKSLNLFWLPANSVPVEEYVPAAETAIKVLLRGRIDENTDFSALKDEPEIDLSVVTSITSRGMLNWLKFIRSRSGLEISSCPEPLVRLAVEVAGVLDGVKVKTILAPFECKACGHEENIETVPSKIFESVSHRCMSCGESLIFSGVIEQYERFIEKLQANF